MESYKGRMPSPLAFSRMRKRTRHEHVIVTGLMKNEQNNEAVMC